VFVMKGGVVYKDLPGSALTASPGAR